jgi:hypothetical protein
VATRGKQVDISLFDLIGLDWIDFLRMGIKISTNNRIHNYVLQGYVISYDVK